MKNQRKDKQEYLVESGIIFLLLLLALIASLLSLSFYTSLFLLICLGISLSIFAILKHYKKWFRSKEFAPLISKFLLIGIYGLLLLFPSYSFPIIILLLLFYIVITVINYRYNFK